MLANRQSSQQLHKPPHVRLLQTLAPFPHQHRICNFQRPYGWNQRRPAFQRHKHCVRVFACLVRKTPGERYRSINHDSGQDRRPSLTISRTLMVSGLIRLRSARIPSTTSWCVSLGPASPTGTSIAAGTPCLVIVILSPCLTWRDQRAMMPHPSGAGTYFDVMTGRISREQRRQLGNELRPGTPSTFLFCMAEQGALEPDLTPASIPDFVLSTLSGSPPSVEPSNAMAYGLLNLETMDWHQEIIAALVGKPIADSHLCTSRGSPCAEALGANSRDPAIRGRVESMSGTGRSRGKGSNG